VSAVPIRFALVAALVVAGCAAPRPEPFAEASTDAVAGRTGVAPRWRKGGAASAEEDARVRDLLSRPLGERPAVDVALIRSRRLQGILERAVAAALDARAGAAPGNPVADLLVRWPHTGGGPVVDAGLTFGLLDFLRLPGRRDAADLEARRAALESAEEIVGAIHEVRAAWFEAVAAGQRAALEESVAEAASIAADLADRQHARGTLPDLDADRHRVLRDEAFLARDRSRLESSAARERLVRGLGLFGGEARLRLPDGLPPLPPAEATPEDAEARAVGRRVDLERARVEVVATRLAAGLAADERLLPDLEAGVSYERESDGDRSTGPSVSVAIPLSGKEAAHASQALAQARGAEDRLHDLAVRIRSEARESVEAVAIARAAVERLRDGIVPRRAAMVEEAQRLYNGMLIGVYDLLDEKREELRSRRDMVEALRDYWLARLRLDEVQGGGAVPPGEAGTPPAPPDEKDGGQDGSKDHHRGHRHGGGR
jgi:cobalt-zinc-cadmium efflux system outer membrane protein